MSLSISKIADNTKKYIVFCNDPSNTVIYTNSIKSPMVQQYARKGAYAIKNDKYKAPIKEEAVC